MRTTLRLGTIFGIELRLDYSWFIIFVLITWSLAGHYFPDAHPGWSSTAYWILAAATSVVFFASVVVHELAHSLVSRAFGTPAHDITLFIFGGAAHLDGEPRCAREELLMAIAGPLASLGLAGVFYGAFLLTREAPGPLHALASWLAWMNLMLALFNLIPGFPLDGGRVLRASVWGLTGDIGRATAIATLVGRLVAFGFIFYGIWQIFDGNWADGLWVAFIGWFLDGASARSAQRRVLDDLMAGHTAREALLTDCPHVLPRLTLDVVMDQVAHPSGRRCFPVMASGQLSGLLTLEQVARVPRSQWPATRAADIMAPIANLSVVGPDATLTTVLTRMAAEDVDQLPVMEDGQFLGIITRDTLLTFLRTRATTPR